MRLASAVVSLALLALSSSAEVPSWPLRRQPGLVWELQSYHAELQDAQDLAKVYSDKDSIPRIVHQTWKSHDIPALNQNWTSSWKEVNPSWLHVIWSDQENEKLVETCFPRLLKFWQDLPNNISKADVIRPLLMYKFGGVYVDLDMQSVKPLDLLMSGRKIALGQMGKDLSFVHSIPNAFMASVPAHNFWLLYVEMIKSAQQLPRRSVESMTGPVMLRNAVVRYIIKHNGMVVNTTRGGKNIDLDILSPSAVYPVNWAAKRLREVPSICDFGGHPETFDSKKCISKYYHDAFMVHWWTHNWTP